MDEETKLDEYVMLTLRSNGIDVNELNGIYGREWIEKNNKYVNELMNNGFLVNKDNLIKLTPKGYAVCDEILSNFK